MGTFPGIASIALAKAVLRNSFDPDKEITLIEVPLEILSRPWQQARLMLTLPQNPLG